jgi:ferredoxin
MDDQLVPENFTIEFEPIGKRVFLSPDKTIMDASLLSGLDLITSCNGLGACASCKIQSISGSLSPLTTSEIAKLTEQEINEGIRLACQVKPLSNLRIYIPPSSLIHGQQLQIDGDHQALEFNPSIHQNPSFWTP